ncbi:LCP family protein [Actinacidiphila rubida]|uniref:Transcriptional attenuator, LytR family n=1 Tax=Actinacidiphila rubida TaxID=310780 RepID=A0A1H8F2L6_9ACTN|nr:LCP family protein [Actinacidiphila rubida]SEN25896.1 transcriptional attenuator, LytR family [Actinacidiphila rubida]
MNDANPHWQHGQGGPDDERDPYARDRYYQQQHYGYDAYGRPLQGPPEQQPRQAAPTQQQTYADPYPNDPSQAAYGGRQGWIPQQPQQPYYEQNPQPQGYDTGQQPVYDTGQHAVYETGQQPVYDTGQHAVYETGQHPVYDTGQHAVYETGQLPVYDTGQHAVYETGQQPVYETGQHEVLSREAAAPPQQRGPDDFHTGQFAFVDEEEDDSEEVIDWLKFSESRTERREEARRRGRNRKVALVLVLVVALVGGAGYLWKAGKIPGLKHDKAAVAATGGGQKRDVIVVHLMPVNGGPSDTALLVDNSTKGRGTTVLIPNALQLTGDDGSATTLDKSVADGVGPTRDALNSLLGTDIKGSWRLDSPYLELLVDSLGDVYVDTNATVKGTGKDSGRTLVRQGKQTELTGQAAVAYATYKGPGESQTDQLSRFGQVMQAVLKKMPSDAADATKTIQGLAQILDPSLNDKALGASMAGLAELAKTGAYDTAVLPVQKDGMLSTQATDSVVKDVLGGTVKQSTGASAQTRVLIKDATGSSKSASMAQAAIVNGGTYAYVPGGKASGTQAASQILYSDPARLAAAKDVASTLGLPATAVKKGTVPSNADLLVVLGKDYKPTTN